MMRELAARASTSQAERAPHLRLLSPQVVNLESYALRTQTVNDRDIAKVPVERFICRGSRDCSIQSEPYKYSVGRDKNAYIVEDVRQVLVHALDCIGR